MALLSNDEVRLRLAFETEGSAGISTLADNLDALAADAGKAAPRFLELANEVRNLGQQQIRITGLETAISSAKQTWSAVSEARREVQALDKALTDAKGAGANREAIKLLEAALRTANGELSSSEKAWARQKDALRTAREAAAAAGVDTKALSSEQARLASALDSASKSLVEQKAAFSTQQAAAQSAATEEARLAQIIETSKTRQKLAAQELLAAEKKAYAESEQAIARSIAKRAEEAAAVEAYSARSKKALADAFSGTGTRSSATIQAEILKINQGLITLASSAKVSGADFDRAFTQAQARISSLRAEMNGGVDPFTSSVNNSNTALSGFSSRLTPIAAAIAAAFGVQEVARMAADFDSLNRSMAAIQGQGIKAAAEVAYLTDAANRLGLEVQSVSKTYTGWLASIKGTALEGEKGRAVFEAVAGAMSKLGKSAADTDGAMLALGQMVSKGKVSMEELRQQLAERLPGAMQAAAAGAGLTVDQLTKMVESGGVLAEDLLPGLARELNKLYGNSSAEGMVSSWNRLKNAVFETVGQIGQAPAVMAAVGAQFAILKEIILVVGTGFVTAGEAVTLLAGSLGALAGAIATGNWSGLREAITKMADESATRINNLASQTLIAKGVQKAFGDSVQQAGAQAAASASQYLAISAAYTEVNAAVTKQIELAEKSLAARQAEGKVALDFVAQFGTEAEKRAEAADQAVIEVAALERVAEAKKIAADVSRAQLTALEAEVAAMEKVSPARKKEIEELQRSTALKQEESAQATATAQASQVRAAGLQTESAALADNSKRVVELREAWKAASIEADTLAAAVKSGAATKEQAAAASIKAGQAEKLYRDAVADATVAAQARLTLAKTEASIQQSAMQNDLYRANTILEIAKQRGNEKEIAQAQIAVWRIELEISEAQAQASRLEAEAMLIVAKAKRAELEASGALTEAKKAELAVMDANIKAKQLEAEKYDLVASRMKSLAYETKELKSSFGELSSSADDAAAAADRAAGSYDGLRTSIVGAASARDKWSTDSSGNIRSEMILTKEWAAQQLESMGVDKERAARVARGYFDEYGNSQNLGGQTISDVLRREADSLTGKGAMATASPSFQTVKVVQVDLRTSSGTSSVKVASQADAATLVSTLQELAARS